MPTYYTPESRWLYLTGLWETATMMDGLSRWEFGGYIEHSENG